MNNQIFIENHHMETQTEFRMNGDINIYPCPFELGQSITAGCREKVSQKGRMVTHEDGTSYFMHYRTDSGSRYTTLLTTEHGEVKASRQRIIIRMVFPKHLAGGQMANVMLHEARQLAQWMKSCITTTNWK